jgi:predicted 2-oxoglutarate/Fe(II)-dependent dioxygenase YbiX
MTIHRWFEDYVFEVPNFLSGVRCDELIAHAEANEFEEATVNMAGGNVRREQFRNNDRLISDDQKLAAEMWSLCQPLVPLTFKGRQAVGLNERMRFYRYDVGQQFDWHQDGYFERDNGERSQFTFMVYLNDGYQGGGTSFADPKHNMFEPFRVVPKKGSALFFYHHLNHRGDAVVAGRKYVMRTDVMYSAPTT